MILDSNVIAQVKKKNTLTKNKVNMFFKKKLKIKKHYCLLKDKSLILTKLLFSNSKKKLKIKLQEDLIQKNLWKKINTK